MAGAFFVIDVVFALYTLIGTLIILCVFMEDLTQGIPLVVMGIPKSSLFPIQVHSMYIFSFLVR